jgi:hypothetical protein
MKTDWLITVITIVVMIIVALLYVIFHGGLGSVQSVTQPN